MMDDMPPQVGDGFIQAHWRDPLDDPNALSLNMGLMEHLNNNNKESNDAPKMPAQKPSHPSNGEEDDDIILMHDEDQEREDESTYAIYAAKQMREKHPNIREHPDPLVETASLRSVQLPPVNFDHCLDE